MHRALILAIWSVVVFAASAAAETAPSPARAVPALPKGIPGFLDPATGLFHPLSSPGGAAPISGQVVANTQWQFLEQYATVDCSLEVELGTGGSGGQFTPTESLGANSSFSAKNAAHNISLDFNYTPSGTGTPELEYELDCIAVDENGDTHTGEAHGGPVALTASNSVVMVAAF